MRNSLKDVRYLNRLPHRNQLGRLLWDIAYALLFRPTPRWAMSGWRRMLLRLFGASVGKGCRVDPHVRIWAPWNLVMGDYVAIAEGVELYSVDKIVLGSKVAISQRAFLCTASHDIRSLRRPLTLAPITVGDHGWVAAEAMLHPGVTIGEGAVIAARAVMRRDAPPWTIWAGNPARMVSERKLDPDLLRAEVVTQGQASERA